MSNLPKFGEYAVAFDQSMEDGDYSRLEQYFADNASYKPGDGTEGVGRAGVLDALKGSVDALEGKCDRREMVGQPGVSEDGDTVTLTYTLKYIKAGREDMVLDGTETIRYEDGLIVAMEDVFDNVDEVMAWRDSL